MASNVSEDAAYQAFLTIPSNPDPTPCILSPPKLTDPSFSTNVFDTTKLWLSTLASHLELCGSYDNHDCLKSCTNTEILLAIENHGMCSGLKRNPPSSHTKPLKTLKLRIKEKGSRSAKRRTVDLQRRVSLKWQTQEPISSDQLEISPSPTSSQKLETHPTSSSSPRS